MWCVGPCNPADPHVGISPSCPTPTAPNSARVSLRCQHPAGPRKELELHAGVILSCPVGLVPLEVRWSFPRALYPYPISISPCPYPHTTAWDLSPSWERAGDSLLHTLYLLYHIIWTEQADSRFYCSASFRAGPFPPGGISSSLYKNPNNQTPKFSKSLQNTSLAPLFSPQSPCKAVFKRMKTTRGVASTRERRALNKELNIWALPSKPWNSVQVKDTFCDKLWG